MHLKPRRSEEGQRVHRPLVGDLRPMTVLAPAFHTIHWSPSFGGRPDLPAIVSAAAGAGFDLIGLDLATVDAYIAGGGTLASLARLLDDAGLGVTDVVALSLRPGDDPAALGAAARGGRGGRRRPVLRGRRRRAGRAGGGRRRLRGRARGARCRRERGWPSSSAATWACARSPMPWPSARTSGWDRAGVLIDTYQCAGRARRPADVAALAAGQVALVQVADAAGPAPAGDGLVTESRHHRLLPGAGDLPIGAYVAAVVSTGYRGPLAAEVLSDAVRAADPARVAGELHAVAGAVRTARRCRREHEHDRRARGLDHRHRLQQLRRGDRRRRPRRPSSPPRSTPGSPTSTPLPPTATAVRRSSSARRWPAAGTRP